MEAVWGLSGACKKIYSALVVATSAAIYDSDAQLGISKIEELVEDF